MTFPLQWTKLSFCTAGRDLHCSCSYVNVSRAAREINPSRHFESCHVATENIFEINNDDFPSKLFRQHWASSTDGQALRRAKAVMNRLGPRYVRQLATSHLNLKVQFRTSMQIWVFTPWRIIPYSVTVTVTGLWSNFWWLSSWKCTQNLLRSYTTAHPNNLYGFYFSYTILHELHICLSMRQIHWPSPNNTSGPFY